VGLGLPVPGVACFVSKAAAAASSPLVAAASHGVTVFFLSGLGACVGALFFSLTNCPFSSLFFSPCVFTRKCILHTFTCGDTLRLVEQTCSRGVQERPIDPARASTAPVACAAAAAAAMPSVPLNVGECPRTARWLHARSARRPRRRSATDRPHTSPPSRRRNRSSEWSQARRVKRLPRQQ
jgi:hypothetical protein